MFVEAWSEYQGVVSIHNTEERDWSISVSNNVSVFTGGNLRGFITKSLKEIELNEER